RVSFCMEPSAPAFTAQGRSSSEKVDVVRMKGMTATSASIPTSLHTEARRFENEDCSKRLGCSVLDEKDVGRPLLPAAWSSTGVCGELVRGRSKQVLQGICQNRPSRRRRARVTEIRHLSIISFLRTYASSLSSPSLDFPAYARSSPNGLLSSKHAPASSCAVMRLHASSNVRMALSQLN